MSKYLSRLGSVVLFSKNGLNLTQALTTFESRFHLIFHDLNMDRSFDIFVLLRIRCQTHLAIGGRLSSVDSSVLTILQSRVRISSTPTMIFPFIVKFCVMFITEFEKRTKIKTIPRYVVFIKLYLLIKKDRA